MKKLIFTAAIFASQACAGEDPYVAAKNMLNADIEVMTVYHLCGETIGLPALYETYRQVAVNDLTMAGKSRSDSVLIIDKVVQAQAADGRKISDEAACREISVDATRKLEMARAKFMNAANIKN